MNTNNIRLFGAKRALAKNCECDFNYTCRDCCEASSIGTQPLQDKDSTCDNSKLNAKPTTAV